MLPSAAKAAEKLLVLEDVQNLGADYEKTLQAWERNFTSSWPRFASRYGTVLPHVAFLPAQLCGAFGARRLQLVQFVFSKGEIRYFLLNWLLAESTAHREAPSRRVPPHTRTEPVCRLCARK
jgi:hypothetical protein